MFILKFQVVLFLKGAGVEFFAVLLSRFFEIACIVL